MKALTISARAGKEADAVSASTTINAPETAMEAIEMSGDEAVLTNAMAHFVVSVQAGLRRDLKLGMAPEEIAAKYADSKMGITRVKSAADPFKAIKGQWGTMSKEDKKKFMDELKSLG